MLYRKIICMTAAFLVMFSSVTVNAESELKVSALSAVLYCADNGQVIYEKSAHEKYEFHAFLSVCIYISSWYIGDMRDIILYRLSLLRCRMYRCGLMRSLCSRSGQSCRSPFIAERTAYLPLTRGIGYIASASGAFHC